MSQHQPLLKSAMILAAGRGERMRPLTDRLPKPLLPLWGKPIMQWHIEALQKQGITDMVINHAWLGDRIEETFQDGTSLGIHINYSRENPALETAGGVRTALPLMKYLSTESPYLLAINGDIVIDWDFSQIQSITQQMAINNDLAYLVMVPNPEHHPQGDFACIESRIQQVSPQIPTYTFAGLGIYHHSLFQPIPIHATHKLAPLLREAMIKNRVGGEILTGFWCDVGTPDRYQKLIKMEKIPFNFI
jgi:MurNAc alpha-1-phosphate uridylyltransferase